MGGRNPAPDRAGEASVNASAAEEVLVASIYERNSALGQDSTLASSSSGRSRAAHRSRRRGAHSQGGGGEPRGAGASAGRQGLGRFGEHDDQRVHPERPPGRQPIRDAGGASPQSRPSRAA